MQAILLLFLRIVYQLAIRLPYEPAGPIHEQSPIRVTERGNPYGFSFEGTNISMNLTSTQEVDLEVKAKNRKGGPADPSSVTGSWEAQTETGAFTVEPDPSNPLKAVAKGNPQANGDQFDVGIAKFTGSRLASDGTQQPIDAQIALNIILPGADTIDVTAGTPREQA